MNPGTPVDTFMHSVARWKRFGFVVSNPFPLTSVLYTYDGETIVEYSTCYLTPRT